MDIPDVSTFKPRIAGRTLYKTSVHINGNVELIDQIKNRYLS
jgi:hypothetical protein